MKNFNSDRGVNKNANHALFMLKVHLFILITATYLIFAKGFPWIEADFQFNVSKNSIKVFALSTDKEVNALQIQGRNGRFYDVHGITNILFMLPVAVLGNFVNKILIGKTGHFLSFLSSLSGIMVVASACLIFFSILSIWKIPLSIRLYTTLLLAFFTIIFPYAITNYEGNLNMLFILSGLCGFFYFLEKNKLRYLIFSGIFTGLAINTREFSWIFLFCISGFILRRSLKEKNIWIAGIFLFAVAPFLIIWGWYNWLRTGLFYVTPITQGILNGKWSMLAPTDSIVAGLKGLLLSKGGSIFIYSPILLVSIFGWREFFRKRKNECALVFCIITCAC